MSELTAKDLMIGDYLSWNGSSYRVIQVNSIDGGLSGCDFMLENGVEDEGEPIPLTPEILEKNGWVKDGYFYRHKELGYMQLGELFEHASLVFTTKCGFSYSIRTSPRCMKYVHQLQHALRLCGIEKEIYL